MADDVAIFIVNYNMPERTEALCKRINTVVKWPYELFVIDNGSDLIGPSPYTEVWLRKNVQTTAGWLAGIAEAKKNGSWLAYWFLITSAEFVGEKDPLTPMAELLIDAPETAGVHPALTEDSTTAWEHMKTRDTGRRRTWMIDNIASLWRADFYEQQGGFDPAMKYGWGIDLEMSWKARQANRWLWIHEGVKVKKVTDIAYSMDRMNMSAEERVRLAGANMDQVLESKYGPDWNWKMRNEFVEEWML